jgi:hypothetical protein
VNRRMRTRTSGGVRGGAGDDPTYSIHPSTAPERIPQDALEQNRTAADAGSFVGVYFGDPIWSLFHSCSLEDGLVMMVEEPDLAADIVMTFTELQVACLEELANRGFHIDGILVYGDIACNTGPFFSPTAFDEVLAPSYKLLFGCAGDHGWTGMLHSDGDVRPFLGVFKNPHSPDRFWLGGRLLHCLA